MIYGGAGNDIIVGSYGSNIIYGGQGNDEIQGGHASDFISGGDGDDYIRSGDSGHDYITGGSGNDTLIGGDSQFGTTLVGGIGDDRLAGNEFTTGDLFIYNRGDDNDTIVNGARDILQFGSGISLYDLSFSRVDANVFIEIAGGGSVLVANWYDDGFEAQKLSTITYDGGFLLAADVDAMTGGETIVGSEAAEVLAGSHYSDRLEGLDRNDTLQGGTGDDTLLGGTGYDTYRFAVSGDGDDTLIDSDGMGNLVVVNEAGLPLFSITGDAILQLNSEPEESFAFSLFAMNSDESTPEEHEPEEIWADEPENTALYYVIAEYNIQLEYNTGTKELLISGWSGSDGGSIRIQNFSSGDLGINLIDPSQNVAPEISGFDAAASYAVLGSPVAVDADISLSDDSEALYSATVVIANKADADEVLAVDVMDTGIATSYDAAMGTLTLSGEASTADYEAVLETLTYSNASGGLATLGTRNLSLTVNDGELDSESAQTSVNVTVTPSMSGTDGFNVLIGTHGRDIIDAKGGKDLIHAHFGDDLVFGGAGNDTVFGGKGDDSLIGASGSDVLQGDRGNDCLVGGEGKDLLIGGHGADRFIYTQLSDSTASAADVIKDFGAGDKIDLSAFDISFDDLDIAVHGPGWSGQHGVFGNLLGYFFNTTSVAIEGTDFEIQLSGRHMLTETDFIFE